MQSSDQNRTRVSWIPFGIGFTKPHHYREMARVCWENRGNLRYAWRILRHGVCDGCSLGPAGLRDATMKGIHLCMTRLKLLRLNTMPALDHARLADVDDEQLGRREPPSLSGLAVRGSAPALDRRVADRFQALHRVLGRRGASAAQLRLPHEVARLGQ